MADWMALWITRITCMSLTTNMKTVNQSVNGYIKYTNLMTSYGAISHTHMRGYLPESQYDTKTQILEHYNGVQLIQHPIIWCY